MIALRTERVQPVVVRAENLLRTYGPLRALDEISFEVPRGSLCGLIGPNGAGKTTLLSILATLDVHYTGRASIAGLDVREDPLVVRTKVGFVPDHAQIYDGLSVVEFLDFFAHAFRLPKAKRRAVVDDAVERCGLTSMKDRPAAGLSKGNTQRLCIARALLHEPELLLLDEPASGLDPRARIELKQLLKRLQRDGVTVLISSHILTELGDFCDHVLVLERGRVVANGPIDALLKAGTSSSRRRLTIEVMSDGERAMKILQGVDELAELYRDGDIISCLFTGGRTVVARTTRALVEADIDVVRVVPERENLEALFLSVTKGELQ